MNATPDRKALFQLRLPQLSHVSRNVQDSMVCWYYDAPNEQVYSVAVMNDIDPRLQTAWSYWQAPVLPQLVAGPCQPQETFALDRIHSVDHVDEANEMVYCVVAGYFVRHLPEGSAYATDYTSGFTEKLSFAFLQTHFPGALERVRIAFSLELSGPEIADYAFHPETAAPTLSLPANPAGY